jgi:hypothetical protein
VRKSEGRRLTPERGRGIPAAHRNRRISAAVAAASGEPIRLLCGDSSGK